MKIFIFLLIAVSIYAGVPMKSSDPFVPSTGEYEINIAVEFEKKESSLIRSPIIDLNYGIYDNIQITLESACIHSDLENGFDSLEVAFKWHFYRGDYFSIAIYPKYISYPIESIFNEGEVYELSLPMSIVLTPNLDLVLDLTYVYPKESADHMEYGSYLKYSNNRNIYFAELFYENSSHQNGSFVLGNIGYMYQLHKNIAFMISIGKEIVSSGKKATLAYSGLQLVF